MSSGIEAEGPRWVLVIEDDPDVGGLLAEGLTKAGYRVVRADHVSDAHAKLAQQRFDCIVTDLYLGRGDGGQVIAGVRLSRGVNARVPIILMSAHLERDMLQKLRPMVDGVLVKPFGLAVLLARVGELTGVPFDPALFAKAAA